MSGKVRHRRPSVLFVNRVYPPYPGATGRVLRDLARGFVKAGWDVTILTTGDRSQIQSDGPIRVIRVKNKSKKASFSAYLSAWRKMFFRALRVPRHDLVVTMTDPPMTVVMGMLLARYKKCKHIHWCQDLYPDLLPALKVSLNQKIYDYLYGLSRRAMNMCDRVVVIGRCMGRHLTQSGVASNKITVIPNWPDRELAKKDSSEHFNDAVSIEKELHDCNGKPMLVNNEPKFRVLYAGNLGRAHPIETIVDAAVHLSVDNPEIEFVFVGDGFGYDQLAEERAKRGLDNIRFLPFQPKERLKALMQSGDIHIVSMADDAEGLLVPCKIYSSLASKRPCIFLGPQGSEAAKIVSDFHAGSVVRQGDTAGLVEAIKRYRFDGGFWYTAHEGASEAARIFVPEEAISAWIQRAGDVVGTKKVKQKPVSQVNEAVKA